jgi:hypothetical protein
MYMDLPNNRGRDLLFLNSPTYLLTIKFTPILVVTFNQVSINVIRVMDSYIINGVIDLSVGVRYEDYYLLS